MHGSLSRFTSALLLITLLYARSLSAQQPQRRLSAPQASVVDGKEGCPITRVPDPPFVPPPPFSSARLGSDEFFYGTPALWAMVEPHWQVHGFAGQKLPYFRQGYEALKEQDPRLAVVARRLDGPEQVVLAGPANGAGTNIGSFMVTGLTIPTAGCWEIAARYTPAPDKTQTLTYTVWVEP
jgi:hypothetical protein